MHFNISPKEPPAPVIANIDAEFSIPSDIIDNLSSLLTLVKRVIDKNIPSKSAITGVPINEKNVFKVPSPKGAEGKSAIDFNAINTIGRSIGENECKAPGSFPYLFIKSSTLSSELDSIYILLATFLAYIIEAATEGIDIRSPTKITKPKLAPKVPAIAIGHGVGGTKQ